MTHAQIGMMVIERLLSQCDPVKPLDGVLRELAEANAVVQSHRYAHTAADVNKGFDWCLKGAECYFRLAVLMALTENDLAELERTDP